jgi:hypothetical protein
MNSSLTEDRDLLSRCFSGDGEAAENLVRRFSNLVYTNTFASTNRTLRIFTIPYSYDSLSMDAKNSNSIEGKTGVAWQHGSG